MSKTKTEITAELGSCWCGLVGPQRLNAQFCHPPKLGLIGISCLCSSSLGPVAHGQAAEITLNFEMNFLSLF